MFDEEFLEKMLEFPGDFYFNHALVDTAVNQGGLFGRKVFVMCERPHSQSRNR